MDNIFPAAIKLFLYTSKSDVPAVFNVYHCSCIFKYILSEMDFSLDDITFVHLIMTNGKFPFCLIFLLIFKL